jgi:hypothetical protein
MILIPVQQASPTKPSKNFTLIALPYTRSVQKWLAALIFDVPGEWVLERIGRYGPRGLKRKMPGYPIRAACGPILRYNPVVVLITNALSEQRWDQRRLFADLSFL